MSVRRFDLEAGSDSFAFDAKTEPKIAFWLSKYPDDRKRSAVIPLLWLAQKDNSGWLSEPAMRAVADRIDMPYIRVYEVATFYTMFRLQPVGEFHVQLCGTTPCMLRGSELLKQTCEIRIGQKGAVSPDGKFSWEEVECLGACVNAPMVQINDDYYEDLTPDSLNQVFDELASTGTSKPGTRIVRITSAPEGGMTTLTDESIYDGSAARPLSVIPNAPVAENTEPQDEPEEPIAEPAKPPEKSPVEAASENVIKKINEKFGEIDVSDESPAKLSEDDAEVAAGVGEASSMPSPAHNLFARKATLDDAARPERLDAPNGGIKDDLKEISGIGPKIETTLNELGIFHFHQIASWTRDNVAWVDGYLSFKGRIDREKWIEQSKELAGGVE